MNALAELLEALINDRIDLATFNAALELLYSCREEKLLVEQNYNHAKSLGPGSTKS